MKTDNGCNEQQRNFQVAPLNSQVTPDVFSPFSHIIKDMEKNNNFFFFLNTADVFSCLFQRDNRLHYL